VTFQHPGLAPRAVFCRRFAAFRSRAGAWEPEHEKRRQVASASFGFQPGDLFLGVGRRDICIKLRVFPFSKPLFTAALPFPAVTARRSGMPVKQGFHDLSLMRMGGGMSGIIAR